MGIRGIYTQLFTILNPTMIARIPPRKTKRMMTTIASLSRIMYDWCVGSVACGRAPRQQGSISYCNVQVLYKAVKLRRVSARKRVSFRRRYDEVFC
jgi:hypothetical protein